MRLSSTDLGILRQIAQGNRNIKNIASALNKSKAQIYRSGKKLIEKGFILHSRRFYEPAKTFPANLLLQILSEHSAIVKPFSNSGIEILTLLFEPKTIPEILKQLKIRKTQLFKKLNQARVISLVRKQNGKYLLNEKLWANAIDFLRNLKHYEQTTDPRVPANSAIYFKNEKEIIFSSREPVHATPTAFSAYEKYGIKILTYTTYYYLPNKKLSKKEVFRHSLCIAEKEPDTRRIIFVALFYKKFRKELSSMKNRMLENLNKVFGGQRIPGYPSLAEIQERAEVYGIKI